MSDTSTSRKFKCPDPGCSKSYPQVQGLSRHKREAHPHLIQTKFKSRQKVRGPESSASKSRPSSSSASSSSASDPNTTDDEKCARSRVVCGEDAECMVTFPKQSDLLEHLKEVHDRDDIVKESKSFASKADFIAWRNDVELSNVLRFVKNRGTAERKSGWAVEYFYCSRSHESDRQGDGRRAPKATIKTGYRCSSFLTVRTNRDGRYEAEYCLQHSGHEPDAARLTLNKQTRGLIAEYIREGRESRWIVDKLAELYTDDNNRDYFITSQDIDNVRQKNCLYPGQRHKNDMESVRLLVEEDAEQARETGWKNFFEYRESVDTAGIFRLSIMMRLIWLSSLCFMRTVKFRSYVRTGQNWPVPLSIGVNESG